MKYLLFLILPSLVLSWNQSINLSQWSGDDINPQVCRIWSYYAYQNCFVWQRLTTEAWNLFARFSTSPDEWGTIIPVTFDSSYDNENHAVAYNYERNKAWVVWQKNIEFNNWEILAVQGDTVGFDTAFRLTNSSNRQDENPSVFVIKDTVWVTWQSNSSETSYSKILAKYYDGTNWSEDFVVDQGNDPFVSNPRINARSNHPIIAYRKWSRSFSHIYYSEYLNNQWTFPAIVCDSSGYNYDPEVICDFVPYASSFFGAIILWDNLTSRDIFRTAYDTFNLHYRITEDTAVTDISPSAINFLLPTLRFYPTMIAWQRGDYIYSKFEDFPEFVPVDTTALCSKPCLTAMGGTHWCIYQKNVGGNWEIFGTYEACGIEEKPSNRVKTKNLIPFNQLVSFLREKPYKVYDITGRAIKNYTNLRSGLYFLKFEGVKVSAVILK